MTFVSLQRLAATLALLCLGASIVLTTTLITDEENRLEEGRLRAERQAREAAVRIGRQLEQFVPVAEELTAGLSDGRIPREGLVPHLEEVVRAHPRLYGVTTLWTPYSFEPDRRLYGPYVIRDGDDLRFVQVADVYDYTRERIDVWYHDTLIHGARWIELWGEASQRFVLLHASPFSRPDRDEAVGVLCLTYTFDWVEEWIRDLDLGATGYGFILSPAGRLIVHPSERLVQSRRTLVDIAEELEDPVLADLAERATAGQRGMLEHEGPSGDVEWIVFEPIPGTGFNLGAVFLEDELVVHGPEHRRRLLHIALWLAAALFASGAAVSLRRFAGRPEPLIWSLSTCAAILCLMLIGLDWVLVRFVEVETAAVRVVDIAGLESYLDTIDATATETLEPPIRLRTGVFVQSIEFASPYNVQLTGYVWQKFEDGVHDEVARGFVLPEAVSLEVEEAYRRRNESVETVGWYFETELRQTFDYSLYPFDHGEAWLRLWPTEFDKNVVLVPDLEAYPLINPRFRPGLDPNVVLPGWTLSESYFAYRTTGYSTDFGITSYAGRDAFPELYFNVGLQRNFLDSFIAHMIPLIVVAFMLFAILMTVNQDEQRVHLTGFNVFGVLTATSALFFVALVAHIQLREAIRAGELMYLEYFYFAIYLTILCGSIYSLIFCSERFRWRWLEYRNSLLLKAAFWPLLLGACLAVTLVTFY